MWKRNLLFVVLIVGGVLTLGANLMPPGETRPRTPYDAAAYRDEDFRAAVAGVDASFAQDWKENRVQPAPPADALLVSRRLALGLMGTIPSLEELRSFEWMPEDERLAWWIDHILQDARFHDYFAERFARSFVGTEEGPFILFRRRRFVTWLSEQIRDKKPHDAMVREVIASKGLWTDHPSTNFVTVTSQNDKGNLPNPVRLAGRVTRAFLGLRLDCAECHNHPYARWKQSDFQGLAAFFGQTRVGFTGVYDGEGEFESSPPGAKPDPEGKEAKQVVAPVVPFAAHLLPESGTRRERLAAWVTHPENPYFARATVNRVWALMVGRPLVEPVDNLEADVAIPPALDLLARDFSGHGFDLRRLIRLIACSRAYRLDSAADREMTELDEKAWAVFPMARLRPEQVVGAAIQASSVLTINAESHILVRLARFGQQNDFVQGYGDSGEDEFDGRGGTIPQRLLLMNGSLVQEKIHAELLTASGMLTRMTADPAKAVELAYLTVLTRRPTAAEREHFEPQLAKGSDNRQQKMEDLFWALVNGTEFSWSH
ncbi:MAG: DUF1553 domain-containing protein [Gemmataceae bacterium]